MKPNAGCWRRRLAALGIVTSLLSACATVNSEPVVGVCLPVVEYDTEFQVRAAEEVQASLSEKSTIVEMMRDYALMREQARLCRYS